VSIPLPPEYRWPELGTRDLVTADFAYGGAFYCLTSAAELGFPGGLKGTLDFKALNKATRLLKAALNANTDLRRLFTHPDHKDLGFLYSIIIVDTSVEQVTEKSIGAETGLCFFADQQIDRSPTGGAVAARCALAHAKGQRRVGEAWTYHSLVTNAFGGKGEFVGTVVSNAEKAGTYSAVRAKVEGYASYTGFHSFVREPTDTLGGGGFVFEKLGK
jgi:trans-L-3-hydroxyproline dehydratase